MTQLKIKDNAQKNKNEFNGISNIVRKVADKTLIELEEEGIFVFPNGIREIEDLTEDQMILQSMNETYRTGNVTGYLGYGKERLIIESRFSSNENDYFFQYLIERVLHFPNIVNLETSTNLDHKIINLFVFIFPHYLKRAMRKGIFKTYIHKKYNDYNPKGYIDIARHIKENTPSIGKVAYNQREYSCDNYLIELVRHTIEFIKKKPYGNRILVDVRDEVKLIIEATPNYQVNDRQKIILENKRNVIRHAYFHEYRALQTLCILILQNQKHQIESGINKMFGILFDGAWLWEEYIHLLVKDYFYHPMNKGNKGAQRLFDGNLGLIYPDFISKNEINRVIADAKYKPMDNIGNRDYFQVLAYMMRFDAKIGMYFYPETGDMQGISLKLNKGSTYEKNVKPREDIKLIKHGLKISQDINSYDEFCKVMKESEQEFIKILLK